ncbi:MAG: M20 aminoacylase family protein [Hyphomicrobiales bacterium]
MVDASELDALATEVTSWRRHLHANPEFGFEEENTARFVAEKLRAFGFEEIEAGVGKTGVVATLRKGSGNRAIAFRADMDALRIEEAGTPDYKSQNPGVMHACGHDGHTAMLLGAAKHLANSGEFDGIVRFIFQPAEEWGKGMQAMLDDGLLERFPFEEAYGVHNMPGMPVGTFATCTGAFMGAEDNFEIVLKGVGGHASRPHVGHDAIVAASATVMALQTVVSRQIDPAQLSVLSVTELLTDGTRNAIAGEARILGDCRSFDPAVSARIEEGLRRVAAGTAAAHGCSVEVTYTREFVPLINNAEMTDHAVAAAREVAEDETLVDADTAPIGGSEDFAILLNHVPGNFIFIGNGDSAGLHNPSYDFDDAAIPHGVAYFAQLAKARLAPSAA